MVGKMVGALVGAGIDRRDGDSGVKGAIIGALTVGALKRIVPLGLIVAGGIAAKRAWDKRSV